MMADDPLRLRCDHCLKDLLFSGERPKFCSNCGHPLPITANGSAAIRVSETVTVPPTAPDPGAATLPPPATSAGTTADVPEVIGGYRLLRRLGGGGMGSVYEAEESASGRHVALKLILPEYGEAPDAIERFRQEGRLASTLVHPRCVFVLAADEDAGRPYIVMELMPGKTLDDLVREKGPLPPEEAVTKILDVIDGLREAHRLGLVHRDVKPSNCFLEANGRVKVGDFGLARSLVSDSRLTRTGTFLGTPLFAAPEQIKMETVDAQSDVYSVAATLYLLLTGRAPFQSPDSLATLARIVSDDPPPMRSLRPELPRALDRVVLRGLERNRKRRWRDLDEFRRALIPLLPAQPSISGTGLRLGAYLIDCTILWCLGQAIGMACVLLFRLSLQAPPQPSLTMAVAAQAVTGAIIWVLYFGVSEGLWGWSPGKRLLRLRVAAGSGSGPPGLGRALLRAAILYLLFAVEPAIAGGILAATVKADTPLTPDQSLVAAVVGLVNTGWSILAVLLTVSTMRAGNGYRALHEVLSGTRTSRLRWPQLRKRRGIGRAAAPLTLLRPDGLPEKVGPYQIRGAVYWGDGQKTLVGADKQLGREVWIRLDKTAAPRPSTDKHDTGREARVRWVGGGSSADGRWDAYLAPAGTPLTSLVAAGQRLSWTEARPILEDLAEELAASCADGTLPQSLTVDQVWLRPDGRVQLLGERLTGPADNGGEPWKTTGEEERALEFLRQVAPAALESSLRAADDGTGPIRAPVPVHAAQILDRLLGVRKPYKTVEQFLNDLDSTRDRPTEVTRLRRAGHLALTAVLLHLPLFLPLFLLIITLAALLDDRENYQHPSPQASQVAYAAIIFCTAFWVVWAFLFRGGYAYWRGGIMLRRADGRKAARWQCAYRALLVWGPVAVLLGLAVTVAHILPAWPGLYLTIWGAGVLLLPVYAVLAIWSPARAPHDRLAGTYPVPP
jgi:hypothetical protein